MWSTCSHKCMPNYQSSPLIRFRVRRVRCIDDEKGKVCEELCEQTAEKPMDTEVRINHLLTRKNVFLINFLRTFINPFSCFHFWAKLTLKLRAVRSYQTARLGNLDHGVCVNVPMVLLVHVLVNKNDRFGA